jgi:hypothetical protein
MRFLGPIMVHGIPNPDRAKSQYCQRNQWQLPVPTPFKVGRKSQANQIALDRLIAPESLEMSELLLGHHVQTTVLFAFHTVGSWGGSRTSDGFLTSVERNFLNGTHQTG